MLRQVSIQRCRRLAVTAMLTALVILAALPPRSQAAREGGGQWSTIIATNFAANAPALWPTGYGHYGSEAVGGGRYTVGAWARHRQFATPLHLRDVGDGQVQATFAMAGPGQVGLVARMNQTADTAYAFWIDGAGYAGATRFALGVGTALFALRTGTVLAGDNTLALQVQGGFLTFSINGRVIYAYTDRLPLPAGAWGVYVRSTAASGTALGRFAAISISGSPVSPVQPILSAGPFTPRIDYDFSLGNNHSWTTGKDSHTSSAIAHGRYTISVIGGYTVVDYPAEFASLADGQIGAVVRLQGQGRVGVMGRWTSTGGARDLWSVYACWIDDHGDVGLVRDSRDTSSTLAELHDGSVKPGQDTTVALRIQGARISCYVNDRRISVYRDPHPLAAGKWGAWVDNYSDAAYVQGKYARILIAW